MYVRQNQLANALDASVAGLKAAGQVATMADNILRENAKSKLFFESQSLESEGNAFLASLENRADYENFQPELNNWMNKKYKDLRNSATNAYTQKLYDQMFTQYKNGMEQKVGLTVMARQRDETISNYNNALTDCINNMSGQDGIDRAKDIINAKVEGNLISREKASLELQDASTKLIYKDEFNYGSSLIESAISNGKSIKDINRAIDAQFNEAEYSIAAYGSDISGTIDFTTITQKVKSDVEKKFNEAVKARQDQTEAYLVNNYSTKLSALQPGPEEEALKAEGRRYLDVLRKNPNSIGTEQLKKWESVFAADKLSEGKSGSGSGGGSAKIPDANKMIGAILSNVFGYATEDDVMGNIHTGKDGIVVFDNWLDSYDPSVNPTDNPFKTYEEYSMWRDAERMEFFKKYKQQFAVDDKTAGLCKELEKYYKAELSGASFSEEYFKTAAIAEFLDATSEINLNNPAEVLDALNATKSNWMGRKLNILVQSEKGKEGSVIWLTENTDKNGDWKDPLKALAEGHFALSHYKEPAGAFGLKKNTKDNKLVYTNVEGRTVLQPQFEEAITGKAGEEWKSLDGLTKSALAFITDEDISEFNMVDWKKDFSKVDGLTGTRIYMKKGTRDIYEIIPLSEKEFEVHKNGTKIATSKDLQQKAEAGPKKDWWKQEQEAADEMLRERMAAEYPLPDQFGKPQDDVFDLSEPDPRRQVPGTKKNDVKTENTPVDAEAEKKAKADAENKAAQEEEERIRKVNESGNKPRMEMTGPDGNLPKFRPEEPAPTPQKTNKKDKKNKGKKK